MSEQRLQPVELDLDRHRNLRIAWADGLTAELPLAQLRKQCPCAECRAAREERARNPLAVMRRVDDEREMVTAASAELVGHYALRIRWQDGHDTGIYEFRLLRTLCEQIS
jgi:DUF971 family protein